MFQLLAIMGRVWTGNFLPYIIYLVAVTAMAKNVSEFED